MILPQSLPEQDRRTRWLRIVAAAWLLLVCAITIINSVGLSRLTEQTHLSQQDAQLKALTTRMSDLARQVDAHEHQPKPASQADFAAARQALEERLTKIEQAEAGDAHADDVQALQARVAAIETRQQQATQTVTPTVSRPAAVKPTPPEPPFRVVGVDLRGGERFLSIMPPATAKLGSIQLLREGDSEGGWQLQSVESHAALFVVNGHTLRVVLP